VTKKETPEFFGPYKKLRQMLELCILQKWIIVRLKNAEGDFFIILLTFLAPKDLEEGDFLILYIYIYLLWDDREKNSMDVGRHTKTQNNNQIPKFQLWLVIHSPSCLCPSGKNQSLFERFWKE
jgi:hypothetical protein